MTRAAAGSPGTTGPGGEPGGSSSGRGPSLLATLIVVWTFALVFMGGLVTSQEAGLSVPDWPLSYGTINPPNWITTPNVNVEHGHRLIGWVLGVLVIALAVVIQRTDRRAWMRRLGWIALALVVVQGVIGGYFRVVLLQHDMAIVHGVLGQGIFCVYVALALFLSRSWRDAAPPEPWDGAAVLRKRALWAAVAVYVQVIIGALIRHSRAGHDLHIVAPHIVWGLVVVVLVVRALLAALARKPKDRRITIPAHAMAGAAGLQVFLGFFTWMANVAGHDEMTRPPFQFWTATAHQAIGALVLAAAVMLVLRAHRHVVPASAGGETRQAAA